MNPWDSALNISADRSSTVMSLNQVSVTVCHHRLWHLGDASRWWIGQRWLILAIVAVGQVLIIFQRHNLEEKSTTNLIWSNGVRHTWYSGCKGTIFKDWTRFLCGFQQLFHKGTKVKIGKRGKTGQLEKDEGNTKKNHFPPTSSACSVFFFLFKVKENLIREKCRSKVL